MCVANCNKSQIDLNQVCNRKVLTKPICIVYYICNDASKNIDRHQRK